MYNNCCKPSEIHQLNEQKEYVLLAQKILEAVLTDARLTGVAGKIWSFLYGKAKFDKGLLVQVEQKLLAKQFNKHVRTISRYISQLQEHGYIRATANYGHNGGRIANTYQLTLPSSTAESIKASKDRKGLNDNGTNGQQSANSNRPTDKNAMPSPGKNVITNNIKNKITNNNTVVAQEQNLEKKETEHCPSPSLQKRPKHLVEPNGLTTNNMASNGDSDGPVEQEKKLNLLKCNLLEAQKNVGLLRGKFKNAIGTPEQTKLLQELTHHEACRDRFQMDISALMRQIQDREKASSQERLLENNGHFVLQLEGKRAFSPFEVQRLKKGLRPFCPAQALPKLMNEIAYSIRFGDLEVQQGTGRPLDIQHGISIALKLVREGRWQPPTGLMDFLHQRAATNGA